MRFLTKDREKKSKYLIGNNTLRAIVSLNPVLAVLEIHLAVLTIFTRIFRYGGNIFAVRNIFQVENNKRANSVVFFGPQYFSLLPSKSHLKII